LRCDCKRIVRIFFSNKVNFWEKDKHHEVIKIIQLEKWGIRRVSVKKSTVSVLCELFRCVLSYRAPKWSLRRAKKRWRASLAPEPKESPRSRWMGWGFGIGCGGGEGGGALPVCGRQEAQAPDQGIGASTEKSKTKGNEMS